MLLLPTTNSVSMRLNNFVSSRVCLPPSNFVSAPMVPLSTDMHQERRTTDEFEFMAGTCPGTATAAIRRRTSSLFVRFSPVFIFAAVLALGIIFYKPVLQAVGGLFEASQPSKPSDRPTADTAPLNGRGDRLAPNAPPAAASVARPAPALVPQPAPGARAASARFRGAASTLFSCASSGSPFAPARKRAGAGRVGTATAPAGSG